MVQCRSNLTGLQGLLRQVARIVPAAVIDQLLAVMFYGNVAMADTVLVRHRITATQTEDEVTHLKRSIHKRFFTDREPFGRFIAADDTVRTLFGDFREVQHIIGAAFKGYRFCRKGHGLTVFALDCKGLTGIHGDRLLFTLGTITRLRIGDLLALPSVVAVRDGFLQDQILDLKRYFVIDRMIGTVQGQCDIHRSDVITRQLCHLPDTVHPFLIFQCDQVGTGTAEFVRHRDLTFVFQMHIDMRHTVAAAGCLRLKAQTGISAPIRFIRTHQDTGMTEVAVVTVRLIFRRPFF